MSTTEEVATRLTESIDKLTVELRTVQINQEAAEQRQRKRRNFQAVCLAVLALAIVVACIAIYRNGDTIKENEASRQQARIASCKQYNVQMKETREGVVQIAVASLEGLAGDPANLTDAELGLREQVVARASATAEATFPYRDCSPEGLDAYFESPPPDPGTTVPED